MESEGIALPAGPRASYKTGDGPEPGNLTFIRPKSGETESHKKISEILPLIDSKKSCKFIHVMLEGGERVISMNRMLGFPEES